MTLQCPAVDATLLVRAAAGIALFGALFWLFRFAMGLRYAKLLREEQRRAEEARGRRLVSEVPGDNGELTLFFDDPAGFSWGERRLAKSDILAARLLLNGRVIDQAARPGVAPPRLAPAADEEGRERWEVALLLGGGHELSIACGHLREGVSRDAARAVFSAVAGAVTRQERSNRGFPRPSEEDGVGGQE
jgi:hypothetical protein